METQEPERAAANGNATSNTPAAEPAAAGEWAQLRGFQLKSGD
jgi:hypothetical protein